MKLDRLIYIDFIKVIAIIGAVAIHTTTIIPIKMEISIFNWWLGNIYNSSVQMSLILFFIVMMDLLLTKNNNIEIFLKNRVVRILISFISGSIIYILFKKFALHKEIEIVNSIFSSLNQSAYYHLWFLYDLIGIYLFILILQTFINHLTKLIVIYYITLWIIGVSIVPLLNLIFQCNIYKYMPMITSYIGYISLGYIIHSIHIRIRKEWFYLTIILFFLIVSTFSYFIYYFSLQSNKLIMYFYNSFAITTIIEAILVFVILKIGGGNKIINIIQIYYYDTWIKFWNLLNSSYCTIVYKKAIWYFCIKWRQYLIYNSLYNKYNINYFQMFYLDITENTLLKKIVPR